MLILIPVKNMQQTLWRAAASVVHQTARQWQLYIMIDPLSTDGSQLVAEAFQKEEQGLPITVRVAKKPTVPAIYREVFDNVRADDGLIAVLDADDELVEDTLTRIIPHFKRDKNLGFLWTQHKELPAKKVGISSAPPKGQSVQEALCTSWWGCSHFRVFRQRFYKRSPLPLSDLPCAADQNIARTVAASGCSWKFLDEILYLHHTDYLGRETLTQRPAQKQHFLQMRARFRDFWRGKHGTHK